MDATRAEDGEYFIIRYVGLRTLPKIKALLAEVEAHAKETGVYRYLFDLRESEEGFSVADRYDLGVHLAGLFGSRYRVAVLLRKEHLTGLVEIVSANRGVTGLTITDSEARARDWMSKEQ